jgi:hypothetical protein
MGFEPFPSQSPSRHIAATIGPLCLSLARVSYPSKRFPLQQPSCVTTVVAFSSLIASAVSSGCSPDHKALLHCKVRFHTTMFPSFYGPMLPWALFPFKVLPSILNAYPKISGAIPPKRHCSEHPSPKRWRSEFAHTEVCAGHERFMSIPAVVQNTLPPATTLTPKRQALPACRPFGQPALEFFERPLVHFPNPYHRLRWSPAVLFLVLQRPFQVEVALTSRVFRAPDRSPLTDCIPPSAIFELGSNHVEVTFCSRHRHLLYASTHRSVMSVSSAR